MTKYLISWDENTSYNVEIEAESEDDALEMWLNVDYNVETADVVAAHVNPFSVEVEEV